MIYTSDNTFIIETENTSYIFRINAIGISEHIYYGPKVRRSFNYRSAGYSRNVIRANEVGINSDYPHLVLNELKSEFSTEGKGDYKTPFVSAYTKDVQTNTLDLRYKAHSIKPGIVRCSSSLAQAIAKEDEATTLSIVYQDKVAGLTLTTHYTCFKGSDVICRKNIIKNTSTQMSLLNHLYSLQLDLDPGDYSLSTFDGAWGRERFENKRAITGTIINESRRGASSADHNPGIIIQNNEDSSCYMVNLIYSAAHREVVEVNNVGQVHILAGMNPDLFQNRLIPHEAFESPEAILIYAKDRDKLSQEAHSFVKKHILRGHNKDKLRPIVFNTWEAMYFNIQEPKLDKLIKKTADMGFEVFMLDDGWFASRDDDATSLGDWYVDVDKLPNGLFELSQKIHKHNMLFGLWLEVEMISERSNLYKKHPTWVIGDPKRKEHAIGRNQYILDLTNPEVKNFILNTVLDLIKRYSIDYIKWDMNRHISDIYSHCKNSDLRDYIHSYILAFAQIQKEVSYAYPNLIIENCSAGGTRFDLATACYSQEIWTSDCSDAFERLRTIEGTTSLYPLFIQGTSVATDPNFATFRSIDIQDRFNIAFFGCLSYSLNLLELDKKEIEIIEKQISFYSYYRHLIKDGDFSVVKSGNRTIWTLSSKDKSIIIALDAIKNAEVNAKEDILKIPCADPDYNYSVISRDGGEYYYIPGDILKYRGLSLLNRNQGEAKQDKMRFVKDFSTHLYIIKRD